MITSIAMVKASGEMVHPAIIPTSKHCHVVLNSGVEKLKCKSPKIFTNFVNKVNFSTRCSNPWLFRREKTKI